MATYWALFFKRNGKFLYKASGHTEYDDDTVAVCRKSFIKEKI